MSSTQVPTTTVYGPKGRLNVNTTSLSEWLAKGYSLNPANEGKKAEPEVPNLSITVNDGDWDGHDFGPSRPKPAWKKAGDIAFEQAIADGKSETDAIFIAVAAARAASKPGDPHYVDQREVGMNGDQQAIKDDQNQPPVGRTANNETGKPDTKGESKADKPKGESKSKQG